MAERNQDSIAYYYAAGRRVTLTPESELIAIDEARVPGDVRAVWSDFCARARPALDSLVLLAPSDLPPRLRAKLDEAAAILPVYRSGSALLIVLPEVRVEVAPSRRARLLSFLQQASIPTSIEPHDDETLTLHLLSHRGEDALSLAASLHETFRPKLADARFVRITPRS